MTPEELVEVIDIIFEKEINDTRKFGKQFYFLEGKDGKIPEIVYKNADVLIDLFSNIQNDEELKKVFISEIFEIDDRCGDDKLLDDVKISVLSNKPLGFYTLFKLGYKDEAIELYQNKESPVSIIGILRYVIDLDNCSFNNSQLGRLLKIVGNVKLDNIKKIPWHTMSEKDNLYTKLINIRFDNVQKQIKGVNLEINQDRKEVSNIIKYLEFDERYNILLTDIDNYINTETSDATSAAMIGNLRVFLSDLIVDLAGKISDITKEPIPHEKDRQEIGNARAYLKDKLKLHNKDDKLINDFVEILHTQGGHSFISSKKYFRLTRNMVIEIVLFLLSKYKEFYDK